MASSSTAGDPSPVALTEYEKQRLENVKRNQAMIAALGIQSAKADIQYAVSKRAEVKGYKRSADKRQREREEPVVTRRLRSSRISWTSEDAQKLESPPTPEPLKKVPTLDNTRRPVPLASVCIQGSSTERFISRLQELDEHIPLSQLSPSKRRNLQEGSTDPREFTLQTSDIARVVPERIMSVAFLPVNDKLLVVAGDKGGHLGFWDVEWDDDDGDGDGVHLYQPHTSPISGIAVQPCSASKVLTCSYDGTVKRLDVDTSMFDLMFTLEDDEVLSAICSVPGSPHCSYVGEGLGFLKMLDTREKVPVSCGQIHQRRINTIDMSMQSPWLMVSSSTDTNVCVWDVRKMKRNQDMLGQIQHQKAVHSAQFSPSGNSIATCSYDNTIAIMKWPSVQNPTYVQHPNMNNRWISTFRAIWGWDDEYIYVGNMKRTIDLISTKYEAECHWLSSPLMTSIPCRLAAHPMRRGILAGCTAGGQIYVWRENVRRDSTNIIWRKGEPFTRRNLQLEG
ncbi:hypothetical protein GOP47_0004179 [Adiantum capillus-veneris]|uniref:DNA damage-binding protein CMR1 n=1 Tax=Adiantum capillus-veneris TaxID=13818 RepID=A0A9D4ZPH7_ADICA|nr:hypothetical protein GOP47_0004179 [Adiantum capillus-veneris]